MSLQKSATVVASIAATILTIIKLTIGILSGSAAVLASAIDSVLDIFVSSFNYFAIYKAEQAPNEKFNYGLGKIEALAAVIEGTIITFSGFLILFKAISNIVEKKEIGYIDSSILVMIISVILTGAIVLFLNRVYEKTKSLVIKSDAIHYKTDLFSNSMVLISLIVVYFTKLNFIDGLFGIAIALYTIKEAYKLIKDGVLMLLDVSLDEDVVQKIEEIIKNEPEVSGFHCLKTRRAGNYNFIDVHIVFTPNISLLKAHDTSDKIEEKIKKLDSSSKWNITIHLDPYDDGIQCQ